MKRFKMWMICLMLCILFCGCGKVFKENKPAIIAQVEEFKGYTRYIGKEEYELCSYFALRDAAEDLSEEEKKERVEAYINRVNAVFYLGNKLGLCEPYSFDVIKLRMEQENEIRKIKKEKGEPIYGLESFSLNTYFQYMLDTVEADLKTYLEGQADNEVIAAARKYFEENKEDFLYREEVVYTSEVAGREETLTADADMISFLGDADPGLADFLLVGEPGEVYEDIAGEGNRRVVIAEVKNSPDTFEHNRDAAIITYIYGPLYTQLIDMVAENNPVTYDTDVIYE